MITPESQVTFLTNLQRLLSEGRFVGTHKYALILSLADISIERGDDVGSELEISTKMIAEKFIYLYWRQTSPYMPKANEVAPAVLRQNVGKQAVTVGRICDVKKRFGDSLACVKSEREIWMPLVSQVASNVRDMPLWKLQTVGSEEFDFLYPNVGKGTTITLRPGVATCFRKFYGLIGDIVRGAWVRYVRRYNRELLGATIDLREFMFGSERSQLGGVRDALLDAGAAKCFYCEKGLSDTTAHVDHFVPWAKYPVDLGHNFVLAHASCNSSKSDHIAAAEFLDKWVDRNLNMRGGLQEAFTTRAIFNDLPTSARVAQWVYSTTADVGGLTWTASSMVPLEHRWRAAINLLLATAG